MTEQTSLLVVKGLEVCFPGRRDEVVAVTGVDLEIQEGEFFGLIGETGAGKSLTGWASINLVPPPGRITRGEVWFGRRNLTSASEEELRRIRGKEIGLIVQNPRAALNPLLTIGKQLSHAYRAHTQATNAEGWKVAVDALRSVGMADADRRAKAFPHQLSGGMAQRVLIAMALINRPRLLIADEPTTGLDATIQAEVLDLMTNLVRAEGSAVWIITHDLGIIANYTTRAAVMFAGEVIETGSTADLFNDPRHPYTIGLMQVLRGGDQKELLSVSGSPPNLANRPRGCQFAYRCPWVESACLEERPVLRELAHRHEARCFVAERRARETISSASSHGATGAS